MAKGNAIVMYLEQARIHGEPIGVTHSEVLFTKPNGYTVQPHNRVVSKADSKTMGESFLNELIYVLGAEDGEERKLPYDREVLVYTSDEINSDNYRTYINAVNTGINCPVHNFKLCQKLRRLCDERGYHLFFSMASEIGKIVHCKICGAPIEARGNRLYCPVCYNQNRRNAAQRSNARTKMEREQTKREEAKMKENNRIATSAAELNMRAKLSNLGGIS